MGKLKQDIDDLINRHYARNVCGEKIGKRLVQFGLAALVNENSEFHGTLDAWDGRLPFHGIMRADSVSVHFGNTEATSEKTAEYEAAIRFAGALFDGYARHHLAKIEDGPDRADKANRNIEAAIRMFSTLGEDYSAPEPAQTAREVPIFADFSPVQDDSVLSAAGSAKKLLSDLHIAEISGQPVLGVRVHVEDRPLMDTMVELGFLNRDEVSDKVTVTTKGKDAIGVRPDGVPDLPVEVASITGNIEERELAARYIDCKIKGVEKWVALNAGSAAKHDYEVMARVLSEIAYEFRVGMHLPTQVIGGRVIPYNDTRDTGCYHADNLAAFFSDVHERNVKAGWWTNIETGEPLKRSVGEMFMLMVTELWEAYEAYLGGDADDKLPQYPGLGVELGDLLIRAADFAGALAAGRIVGPGVTPVNNAGAAMFHKVGVIAVQYESIRKTPKAVGDPETGEALPAVCVAEMVDAKLAYNASRADHKIENRLKDGGKKT